MVLHAPDTKAQVMSRLCFDVLRHLRDITISLSSAPSFAVPEAEECAICKGRLSESASVARHDTCQHMFCAPCLQQWSLVLTWNQSDGPRPVTCPMCRGVLMASSTTDGQQPTEPRQALGELASSTYQDPSRDAMYRIASILGEPVESDGPRSRQENRFDDPVGRYEPRRRMPLRDAIAYEARIISEQMHQSSSLRAITSHAGFQPDPTRTRNRPAQSRSAHSHTRPRSLLSTQRSVQINSEILEQTVTVSRELDTVDDRNQRVARSTRTSHDMYEHEEYGGFSVAEWDDDTEEHVQMAVEVEVAGVRLGSAAQIRRFRRMMRRQEILDGEKRDG